MDELFQQLRDDYLWLRHNFGDAVAKEIIMMTADWRTLQRHYSSVSDN